MNPGVTEGLIGHEEVGEAGRALQANSPALDQLSQLVLDRILGLLVLEDAAQ